MTDFADLTDPTANDTLAGVPHHSQHTLVNTKLRDLPDIRDYGAVESPTEDATDNAAALADAIDDLGDEGGLLTGPIGIFQYDGTFTFPSGVGFIGKGGRGQVDVTGATQLKAMHTSGPAIRVYGENVTLQNFTLTSGTDRYAAAAGTNYGVLVEGPDTTNGTASRFYAHKIRITRQPSHGIILVDSVEQSALNQVDVDNVGGHGIWIAPGSLTSRSNSSPPGMVDIVNCRVSQNGGHALVIGMPGTTTGDDTPYRILVHNFEHYWSGQDPTMLYEDYCAYVFGESITFEGSAFNGQNVAGDASVLGGMYIEGRHIGLDNMRFINCTAPAVQVGNRVSFSTINVRFGPRLFFNNQFEDPGYYDPAIAVDASASFVTATTWANPDVTSLITPGVSGGEWELNGVHSPRTFTADDPANVPLTVTGTTSQSAALQRWKTTAGAVVAEVVPTGSWGSTVFYGASGSTTVSERVYADDGNGPIHTFSKSRSTTSGGVATVNDGDLLGVTVYQGADSAALRNAAQTDVLVDGSPGPGSMPGRYRILTTPSGATVAVERTTWRQNGLMDHKYALSLSNAITPTTLTGNQDTDYAPTGIDAAYAVRLSSDASRDLNGLTVTGVAGGHMKLLINVGAQNIVLKHNVGTTATLRFRCPGATDFTLRADASVEIRYDGTSGRWRVLGV